MSVGMREKLARAIHDVMENLPPQDTKAYEQAADAVLDALMEPGDHMLKAGQDAWYPSEGSVIASWRKMITAAKSGE